MVASMTTSSESLMQLEARVRGGDAVALGEYLARERGRLLGAIDRQIGAALRRKVEPEDILQEVSVACVKACAEVDLSERDIFAWLCQMAERRVIDAHRRYFGAQKRAAGREVPLDGKPTPQSNGALVDLLIASLTTPSEAFSRGQREFQLLEALATLPAEAQQAIKMRYVENLPSRDIAEKLGKSDGAVRVLLSRSIKKLGDLLKDVLSGSR